MSAYFQDVNSKVVLKFDLELDIRDIRNQVGDYKEVSEDVYNEYKGFQPKKAEKPTK